MSENKKEIKYIKCLEHWEVLSLFSLALCFLLSNFTHFILSDACSRSDQFLSPQYCASQMVPKTAQYFHVLLPHLVLTHGFVVNFLFEGLQVGWAWLYQTTAGSRLRPYISLIVDPGQVVTTMARFSLTGDGRRLRRARENM